MPIRNFNRLNQKNSYIHSGNIHIAILIDNNFYFLYDYSSKGKIFVDFKKDDIGEYIASFGSLIQVDHYVNEIASFIIHYKQKSTIKVDELYIILKEQVIRKYRRHVGKFDIC